MQIDQKNNTSRQEFWFCGILLLAGLLAYHILYFNSVLPDLEGWGIYYVELLERGQFPYRDFAYYLPPLNLLIEWGFWKLSFGYLLAFRGWYLLERIVAVALLYKLTTKWFQPRFAWIACLTGACLGAATVHDLCGDYNQTQTLFCIMLAHLVAGFLESDDAAGNTSKYRYMLLAGIQISLMLLLKQNLGFSAVVVCLIFLIVYCITVHDGRFWRYCGATALGAVLPLAVVCVLLVANGAFVPFLEQFWGTAGAKGGIGTILTSVRYLGEHNTMGLFLLGVMLAVMIQKFANKKNRYYNLIFYLSAFVFMFTLWLSQKNALVIAGKTILEFWPLQILCALLLVCSIFFCWCSKEEKLKSIVEWNYSMPVIFLLCLMLSFIIINKDGACSELFNRTSLYTSVFNQMVYFSRYALIVVIVLCTLPSKRGRNPLLPKSALSLALCGCIDVYATNMASGGGLVYREMFITAPILFLLIFSYKLPKWRGFKNYALCLLCVLLCALGMLQKYTGAYTWWCGTNYAWYLPARSESVQVDALTGFRLPEVKKREYEEIVHIIEENGTEDSTVWGFPYVKIFNILTDHYDLSDPVPVLFYDVCSDEMAEKEVEWLRESSPDFVIWCDIPQCIDVHEDFFRNGERMAQRDIIDWFADIAPKEYTLVGQIENLFVYQRKDKLPVHYMYIQNPEAKNTTISEN